MFSEPVEPPGLCRLTHLISVGRPPNPGPSERSRRTASYRGRDVKCLNSFVGAHAKTSCALPHAFYKAFQLFMHLLKDVMSRSVQVISPDATIVEAAGRMRDGNFGMMPVGENGLHF